MKENTKIYVIGIDVGQKGGIATLEYNLGRKIVKATVHSMDFEYLHTLLREEKFNKHETYIGVENVHSFKSQGVVSMFTFGKSFGYIIGSITQAQHECHLIQPQVWKKYFNLIKKDKKESIKRCKQIYPKVSLLPSIRCKVDSDGMAESLLIATYMKYIVETKLEAFI